MSTYKYSLKQAHEIIDTLTSEYAVYQSMIAIIFGTHYIKELTELGPWKALGMEQIVVPDGTVPAKRQFFPNGMEGGWVRKEDDDA